MKPMSSDAYARYEQILKQWRQEGRRVSWKEYRLAYELAQEGEAERTQREGTHV